VLESEVDHPPEIDGSNTHRETKAVPFHSPEPDPPVIVGDQPCDGTFHHRSPPPIVLGEVTLSPRTSGFHQFVVMRIEVESATVFGSGAPFPQGTSMAVVSEDGRAALGDRDRVASWAGDGAR
jgi:hypothetical protein